MVANLTSCTKLFVLHPQMSNPTSPPTTSAPRIGTPVATAFPLWLDVPAVLADEASLLALVLLPLALLPLTLLVVCGLEADDDPDPEPAAAVIRLATLLLPAGVAVARKEFPFEMAVEATLSPLETAVEATFSPLEKALEAMVAPSLVTVPRNEAPL